MKISEMREQTFLSLQSTLNDLKKEQFTMRMSFGSGQLTKTHLMKEMKRRIARVMTVLAEKKEPVE